jgi:hypothetical protein
MNWLILGVLLWIGAHLFKRILPKQRAALGKTGKALVAALVWRYSRSHYALHSRAYTIGWATR